MKDSQYVRMDVYVYNHKFNFLSCVIFPNRYIHRIGSWCRHVPPPCVAVVSGGPNLGGDGEEEEGSL